jgi:ubiquinone/menaquinone biosynthesis C-methylase UbiE
MTNKYRTQVELLGSKEIKRYKQVYGLKDGMNIIDFGCGPGFMAAKLLQDFPNSKLTCVEIDDEFITLNKKQHEQLINSGRLTIIQKSAHDTGLAENTFDFALARLLFQHIRSTGMIDKVCREAMRVLKPGASFVIVDSDEHYGDLVFPQIDSVNEVEAAFFKLRENKQTRPESDPQSGRKLYSDLQRNGFLNVESEVVLAHSDEFGFEAALPLFDPALYEGLVSMNVVSKGKLAAIRSYFYDFYKKSTDRMIMIILLLAGGVKPGLVEDKPKGPVLKDPSKIEFSIFNFVVVITVFMLIAVVVSAIAMWRWNHRIKSHVV